MKNMFLSVIALLSLMGSVGFASVTDVQKPAKINLVQAVDLMKKANGKDWEFVFYETTPLAGVATVDDHVFEGTIRDFILGAKQSYGQKSFETRNGIVDVGWNQISVRGKATLADSAKEYEDYAFDLATPTTEDPAYESSGSDYVELASVVGPIVSWRHESSSCSSGCEEFENLLAKDMDGNDVSLKRVATEESILSAFKRNRDLRHFLRKSKKHGGVEALLNTVSLAEAEQVLKSFLTYEEDLSLTTYDGLNGFAIESYDQNSNRVSVVLALSEWYFDSHSFIVPVKLVLEAKPEMAEGLRDALTGKGAFSSQLLPAISTIPGAHAQPKPSQANHAGRKGSKHRK